MASVSFSTGYLQGSFSRYIILADAVHAIKPVLSHTEPRDLEELVTARSNCNIQGK